MAVVGVGYDLDDLRKPPNGFGYLIPKVENRKILGALWTSSIFPGSRSPEGKFLIRVMVGGAKNHETPFLPEEELLATVKEELAVTMGLTAEPSFFTVIRWKEAIPLYTVGHLERLAEAEKELPPGVVLAGNAYRGVGINDCVREAEVAAGKVMETVK
jgi:oxygen-dependent protoporphyrinogen oxidase